MSKVFRLYKNGDNTFTDWHESASFPYNSENRDGKNGIDDPEGASSKSEITSIPSPFARIDLVKTAFVRVCQPDKETKKINLDGKTIFHKMVSDTLDVGEIFFNIDKFSDKIEIIKWDASSQISQLENSEKSGHRFLADALRKYMQSDAKAYNFDRLQDIYILNYKNGLNALDVIGATSPRTFFFSTANKLDDVSREINFGQDRPFDSDFQPLYKRDKDYIKSWFVLSKSVPDFADLFPEVYEYLQATLKMLHVDFRNELKGLTSSDPLAKSNIQISFDQQINIVEVLGYPVLKKLNEPIKGSDFEIITKAQLPHVPLALPVESGNMYAGLHYTTALWGKDNRADYFDEQNDLSQRRLPNDGTIYPYLTIGDFLEDNIIQVPHTLNKSNFFDGNYDGAQNAKKSYLLPLKKKFFEFFTVEELQRSFADGSTMIKMENINDISVKVYLRIPIKGNGSVRFVEYTKIYYGGGNAADPSRNQGAIVEADFTGFVMPNIQFANPKDALYKVCCVSTFKRNYNLSFHKGTNELKTTNACRNKNNEYAYKAVTYSLEGDNFEYLVLKDANESQGVLIPKFSVQQNTEQFKIAIDLGTSNTHVEVMKNGESESHALSYGIKDCPLAKMFQTSSDDIFNDLLEQEGLEEYDFLPFILGEDSMFKFPTRTVLSHAKGIDWNKKIVPYELVNIPFAYNKRVGLDYNDTPKDNIKWGKGLEQRYISVFIDCLMLMLRNKVITNGGDLQQTEITWFYPISMSPKRVNHIRETWNEAYRKYFGSGATKSMTESAAPIQYFFRQNATATRLVSIDIGGGTTDVAFAKDGDLQHVTSFKFASNDLFESSLDASLRNGIIDYFKKIVENKIKDIDELKKILDSNTKPSNIASFFFSLQENPAAADLDKSVINFDSLLREDEHFKIVFIIFYTAIIYHIAQILLLMGMPMPRHISFSGNGSKVLRVITSDSKLLAKFTCKIFQLLGVEAVDGKLEILGLGVDDSSPKQATCKGALVTSHPLDEDKDKIIILKGDGTSFVSNEDTYDSIDAAYISKTKGAVKRFFEFTLDKLNREFNFNDNFGVTPESLNLAKAICVDDLETFIKRGITLGQEDSNAKEKISETLFFYPIKGVMNVLSGAINDSLKNDNN